MIFTQIYNKPLAINFDGPHHLRSVQIKIDMLDKIATVIHTKKCPNPHMVRGPVKRLGQAGAAVRALLDLVAMQFALGLHITLGGGFHTSQISQESLGNHENP